MTEINKNELIKKVCEQLEADLHYELSAPLEAWEKEKNAEIEALKLFYNMQGEESQNVQKEYLRFQSNAGRTITQLMDIGKANDRTKLAEDKVASLLTTIESQKKEIEALQHELNHLKNPENAKYIIKLKGKEVYLKKKNGPSTHTNKKSEALIFNSKEEADKECFGDELIILHDTPHIQEGEKVNER